MSALWVIAAWLIASVIFVLGWCLGFRLGRQSRPRTWREFLRVPDDA